VIPMVMVRSDIPQTIEDRFERQDRGEARLGQANEWSLNAAGAFVPPGVAKPSTMPVSHDDNSAAWTAGLALRIDIANQVARRVATSANAIMPTSLMRAADVTPRNRGRVYIDVKPGRTT
jgi:hypothetical protein